MVDFAQSDQHNGSLNLPPITNPPPNFFGGTGEDTSPTAANFDFNEGQADGQDQEGGHEENDAKRRRIARVGSLTLIVTCWGLTCVVGV